MAHPWTLMSLPLVLYPLNPDADETQFESLEVCRAEDLGLVVVAQGKGRFWEDLPKHVPGMIYEGAVLELVTSDGCRATIRGYIPTLRSTSARFGTNGITRISGSASEVSVALSTQDTRPAIVIEWLSNVPPRFWPRITTLEEVTTSTWTRGQQSVATTATTTRKSGLDHAELQVGLPSLSKVFFGRVDRDESVSDGNDGFGFIEYQPGGAGLPSPELRHSVRRALEFLMGTSFGVIGWSEHGNERAPTSATVLSAYQAGGGKSPLPPALLHAKHSEGLDEAIMEAFLRAYLQKEPDYDLNRAVWLYLHAQGAPLDMAAGYVGAAFEILVRGYFNENSNKQRAKRLPPDVWKFIGNEMRRAIDSLASDDKWNESKPQLAAIRDRVGNLNALSGTELNRLFLDELGLEHGEAERVGLMARNDAAHANPLDASTHDSVLRSYRALHTLFARALFAVLGVDVSYIDYGTLGYPTRSLSAPQGVSGEGG